MSPVLIEVVACRRCLLSCWFGPHATTPHLYVGHHVLSGQRLSRVSESRRGHHHYRVQRALKLQMQNVVHRRASVKQTVNDFAVIILNVAKISETYSSCLYEVHDHYLRLAFFCNCRVSRVTARTRACVARLFWICHSSSTEGYAINTVQVWGYESELTHYRLIHKTPDLLLITDSSTVYEIWLFVACQMRHFWRPSIMH
jgi:hypothetical protein